MPPALLALDSWVTAVSTLTSNCGTGLWWGSSRVLVPSGCLVQDRQVRDPAGLKHQLGWGCQPGFEPSCMVMQALDRSCPLWAYAKMPLLPFFPSCLSTLCPFPCWDAWGCIESLMQLPDAPACCCLPGLRIAADMFGRRKWGSHFIPLPPWFCVKMGFASLIKEVAVLGSTPRERSSAGSMRRLVPGTALASGCWHFPEQLLGMGTKSLQSLHLDG